MRKVQLLPLLALIFTVAAQAQEAAIRHLLDQQARDWNQGNIEAFMTAYEDSPQTTFVGQKVEYGYANILARYHRLYANPESMGKLTFTHLAVRVLDPNYALATGNFHLERTPAGGGNADGIFSLFFRNEPQGWKIILDHSNRTN